MGIITDCFAEERLLLDVFVADFKNAAEYWLFPYESPTFRYELEGVWDEVRPLYEQLHAYVRRKLRDLYGPDKVSRKAPLPAHILGNN
jgi:peptidyl-dipeptidase A